MRPPPSRRTLILLRGLVALVLIAGSVAAVGYVRSRSTAAPREVEAALAALQARDAAELERIEGRSRQSSCAPLVHGMLLMCRDRPAEAVAPLQEAAAVPEVRFVALALLGEALYRSGRFLEAEQALRAVLDHDPGQLTSRRLLASTYYDMGATALALQQLEIIAAQDADDPRPGRLQGLIYKDREQFSQAVTAYAESLRRDAGQPDREDILLELAKCQVKSLRHEDALATLAEAAQSADSLALQARCEAALGRSERAAGLADASLQRDPEHLQALLLRAELHLDADEPAAAEECLQRAVRAHPVEYEARYQLAGVYRRLGRETDAALELAEMERLQALRREFTELHERAQNDLHDGDLRYRLGRLSQELGKPELARVWFAATLAIDPAHAGARAAMEERGPKL